MIKKGGEGTLVNQRGRTDLRGRRGPWGMTFTMTAAKGILAICHFGGRRVGRAFVHG